MTTFITHLFIGPLILLIGFIFKMYPPKKINRIYGYRTPMSMKNEHTWKEANTHSAESMIKVGVLTTLFQVLTQILFEYESAMMISSIFLVVALLISVVLTEKHLRNKFDKDGNWKDELV
jgi:uncharacterized membrane protein